MTDLTRRAMLAIGGAALLVQSPPARAQDLLKSLGGMIDKATGSGGSSGGGSGGLAVGDIAKGLKEALRVGAERVIGRVGKADGYNADPAIHIPLPDQLQQVQGLLRKFGLSSLADDVETRLNRAAEAAAPKTKELLWKAVTDMTLDDAKRIYDGPADAATQYFKRVASGDLKGVIRPVVDETLSDVGAISAYDNLMGQYKALPLVPDVKADLGEHATTKALDGLFHYLAKEEAAIRQNPAMRTTQILKTVFGG